MGKLSEAGPLFSGLGEFPALSVGIRATSVHAVRFRTYDSVQERLVQDLCVGRHQCDSTLQG